MPFGCAWFWMLDLDQYPDPPPGLPDPYDPTGDALFWWTTCLLIPLVGIGYRLYLLLQIWEADWWWTVVLIALLALQVLYVYWVAWDSHRWRMPERTLFWCFSMLLMGFFVYPYYRGVWLMRVARSQRE